jgi:hypothetical protein
VEQPDPVVPRFDELDRAVTVLLVDGQIAGDRRRAEVVERHEEPHAEAVGDEIIEQEKLTYPRKSSNSAKKSR